MSLKLYFGPYESHGVIRHKTQKLCGITNELSKLGYEIEVIPTKRLNTLIIHYKEKEIYRCDLRHLMFNIDYDDDPVAQNLVRAVEEAKSLFDTEQNILTFDKHHVQVRESFVHPEDHEVKVHLEDKSLSGTNSM